MTIPFPSAKMTHYGLRISEYRACRAACTCALAPRQRSGCLGAAAPVTGAAADEHNLNVVDCDASVTVPRLSCVKTLFASSPASLSHKAFTQVELHYNIRSDNHNYRRNTPNTLFRPRITPLCQDVRDTLMSRFSALAWPPF